MASRFASLALNHLTREYPNKLTHALSGPEDAQGPRALHPIFYGSYDWHSCVHGYWLLLRLLERYPELPERDKIIAVVDAHLPLRTWRARCTTCNKNSITASNVLTAGHGFWRWLNSLMP